MIELNELKKKYEKGDRDFFDGDFRHANLSFQTLSYANFRFADLSHANLSGAVLQNCDFSNANLSFANFSNADLTSSTLLGSNLEGTILASAILRDSSYNNETVLPHGINLNSYGAINLDSLSQAKIQLSQESSTEHRHIDESNLSQLELNDLDGQINQSTNRLEITEKDKEYSGLSSHKGREVSGNHYQNDIDIDASLSSSRVTGFIPDNINDEYKKVKDFFKSKILLEGKKELEIQEQLLRDKVDERFSKIEKKYQHKFRGIRNHKPKNFEVVNHSLKLESYIKNGVIALIILFFFQNVIVSYILLFYLSVLLLKVIHNYRTNLYPSKYINEIKKLLKDKNKDQDNFRQGCINKIDEFKFLSVKPVSYERIAQLSPVERFFLYRAWHETCEEKYILGDQKYVFEPVTYQYNKSPASLSKVAIGVSLTKKKPASFVQSGIKVVLTINPKPDYWIIQDSADNFWLFPKKGWKPSGITSMSLFSKVFKYEGLTSSHFKVLKPALASRSSTNTWTLQEMGKVKFY